MNLSGIRIHPAAHFQLSNGLKTIYHTDHSNAIVCMQLNIKIGSIYETAQQNGFSHFIEHLAFKSTASFPYNTISDIVPKLGGMINAYTDFDSTCYYLLLPSEHFDQGIRILSELAFAATFTAEDVRLEKDIIIEEIKQYENEPKVDFIEFIQGDYFHKNPMKYPVLGTVNNIKAVTYEKLRAFYQYYYQPGNAFLVISGDIDQKHMSDSISEHFSVWQAQNISLPDLSSFLEPEILSARSVFRYKKQSNRYLAFVLPELSERHPDSNELLIGMRLFAIGKSSRLYRRLVEKEKLCSSVKVSSLCGILSGASIIQISPSTKNGIERIVAIVEEEYFRILNGDVDANEFAMVKLDIINSWLYSFESMESVASTLAAEELYGEYSALYEYPEQIAKICLPELFPKLRKYWNANNMHIWFQDSHRHYESYFHALQIKPIDLYAEIKPISIPSAKLDVLPEQTYSNCLINNYKQIDNACDIFEFQCSSGLRVIYKYQPEKQICGMSLSTSISQLMEDPQQRGINYLCSTAMLYGSQLHSYEQIQDISRKLGFSLRVSHHLDSTSFRAKCFSEDMNTVLMLLSELLLLPAFRQKYIGMIRANSLDNLRREKNYPVNYAFKQWQRLLFGNANNLDNATGNIGSMANITMQDIKVWHHSCGFPAGFVLAIIGDQPVEKVFGAVETFFGETQVFPTSQQKLIPQPRYSIQKVSQRLQKKGGEQAIINLGGYACPASDHTQNTAFHILAQVIGGDINSRMFNILREKYGYAYQTGFDFSSIHDLGFWNAYIFCDPQFYKESLRLMKEIINEVSANGITAEELLTAQNYLVGMQRFDAESVSWQASTISNLLCLGYDLDHYLTREKRIRSIGLEDIRRTASTWLLADNFYTHILL